MKNFRKPHPRPKKSSLIIGRDAVTRALQEGQGLERIFLQTDLAGPDTEKIRRLAAESGIPVNKVPVQKLNNFNIVGHEGGVALISKIKYLDLQEVISFVVEQGESPLFIMLDGVTDIRNIGAIARSAFCFGVHAIIIPEKGVGALNDDAILTSAGALEQISVCRVKSLVKAADDLHLNGISVYAAEMKATLSIEKCDLSVPCALVMGAEEKGISDALLKTCDARFSIPMSGAFDSLNVSVAAGVSLYEACRQRLGKS